MQLDMQMSYEVSYLEEEEASLRKAYILGYKRGLKATEKSNAPSEFMRGYQKGLKVIGEVILSDIDARAGAYKKEQGYKVDELGRISYVKPLRTKKSAG